MKLKKVFAYLIVGVILSSGSFILSDDSIAYASSANTIYVEKTVSISPRAEKTEWKYRMVNGKGQKRLWSITYSKWFTEWEWM